MTSWRPSRATWWRRCRSSGGRHEERGAAPGSTRCRLGGARKGGPPYGVSAERSGEWHGAGRAAGAIDACSRPAASDAGPAGRSALGARRDGHACRRRLTWRASMIRILSSSPALGTPRLHGTGPWAQDPEGATRSLAPAHDRGAGGSGSERYPCRLPRLTTPAPDTGDEIRASARDGSPRGARPLLVERARPDTISVADGARPAGSVRGAVGLGRRDGLRGGARGLRILAVPRLERSTAMRGGLDSP